MLDGLGKWVAALGAVLALGQSGTTAVQGYFDSLSQATKAKHDNDVAEIRERNSLATEYLKLVIDKDTATPDRAMLLGALSELKDHPLQQWALKRHTAVQKIQEDIFKADQQRVDAALASRVASE
jgi:hypothetical protein